MEESSRSNQKRRTRKDLLQAAARLMQQGRSPSLDEVAAEAMVSRATAYRYFPNAEALLVEAALDMAAPAPDRVFDGAPADDPVARMERVDAAFEAMIAANEGPLRMMLAHAVQRPLRQAEDGDLPARQNRRTPLIEAALAPARAQLKPADVKPLARALALVVGTESMVVFKDVLQLGDADARKARRWAIRAMIEAAKR
ncbi:MAG: TetR/AcrR family transcriptional regulator [Hyphomonadaceae bacterium]|nr:TetR/AcrR family transcriptional regulator [Hyphomonadaceae bacterium]GIK47502.1 MAG: TetR family transcriptional regulator [Alphaproteobacteria bacterium]